MVQRLYPRSLSLRHIIYAGSDQKEGTGCWEWRHGKHRYGYGQACRPDGTQVTAHRLAWEAWNGPIPKGKHICHTCDNPSCCNPLHLYAGDRFSNMGDMGKRRRQWLAAKKDRGEIVPAPIIPEHRRARGQRVGTSKLTEQQIKEILSDNRKQRDIAKDYGVSQAQIQRIKSGKSWAKLHGAPLSNRCPYQH